MPERPETRLQAACARKVSVFLPQIPRHGSRLGLEGPSKKIRFRPRKKRSPRAPASQSWLIMLPGPARANLCRAGRCFLITCGCRCSAAAMAGRRKIPAVICRTFLRTPEIGESVVGEKIAVPSEALVAGCRPGPGLTLRSLRRPGHRFRWMFRLGGPRAEPRGGEKVGGRWRKPSLGREKQTARIYLPGGGGAPSTMRSWKSVPVRNALRESKGNSGRGRVIHRRGPALRNRI